MRKQPKPVFVHLDLVLDRFVLVPKEGPTTTPPLRQDRDTLLLGDEVVARRFRGSVGGQYQGVLWVKSITAPAECRDAWNNSYVQLLAFERRWTVAMSYAVPSTLAEALRIHQIAEDAEALTAKLRADGWSPLAERHLHAEFDIADFFEAGEVSTLLDEDVARVLRESPLALPPFTEEKPTLFEPGSSKRPGARIVPEPWLTPRGARLAHAAANLSSREGVPVLVAVRRVLALES